MERKLWNSETINNEIEFCKVYSMEEKEKIEKIFLKNRISYSCRFEEHGLFQRIFSSGKRNRIVCTFRIHDEELPRAKMLTGYVPKEDGGKGKKR